MKIRFATKDEVATWDELVLANPDGGNIFQSLEFAEQKLMNQWQHRYVIAGKIAITILEKTVFGLGKLWYLPKGPGVADIRQLKTLLKSLKSFASSQGVFLLKIEPELLKQPEVDNYLLDLGLIPAIPIQPNSSTILLDLTPKLDDVLTGLNQKGRHAIRRAERDGVTVKRVSSSDVNCQLMYQLLSETAAGNFRIRRFEYYKAFWQRFSDSGYGQLFFAYVDGKVVAGAYGLIFGHKSTYKDGASVRQRTVYGASHLLQWEVIFWAKQCGSLIHDLCGSPSSDQINNPQHRHYGIGRFKTSFNKKVTDYVGVYDLPIRGIKYRIWEIIGQRLVNRLSDAIHHESWY